MTDREPPVVSGRDAYNRHVKVVAHVDEVLQACPECQVGKCWNCDGQTWDDALDAPVSCPCEKKGHQ